MSRLFSKAQKAAISARQDGVCAVDGCGASIDQYDHVLAHGLSGQTVLENGEGLCLACHKAKTAGDIRRMRKADRAGKKCVGPRPPSKRPLKGRSNWPAGRKLQGRNTLRKPR